MAEREIYGLTPNLLLRVLGEAGRDADGDLEMFESEEVVVESDDMFG